MYGNFCESYYDHSCTIQHGRDVLKADIKGNTLIQSLKRWWYDLFLLSYSDSRNIVYYNSSHAVKHARAKQFRRHKDRIHPLSKFKTFWDGLLLYIILITKFIFYHTSSMITGDLPLFFYFVGAFFEIFMIFDIYVNIKCGYIDALSKTIVLNLRKSFERYCSTKLFFHVAGAIPMHMLMFLRYGMEVNCTRLCKSNKFMCTLIILNTFSLLRFIEASLYWYRERETYLATCFFRLLRIALVALLTMAQFILICDTITLLSFMDSGEVDINLYYSRLLRTKYRLNSGDSNVMLFSFDTMRIFKALFIGNFENISRKAHLDKIWTLIGYVIASIFTFWSLIEVYTCLSRIHFVQDHINFTKTAVLRLAETRRLSDRICWKVKRYYNFRMSQLTLVERCNSLYNALPLILKKEIMMHSYGRLLTRIPYFSEWPIKLIEAMVLLLKDEIFLEHDVVAEAGVEGEGLLLLDVGMLAVYTSDHQETGHLIDGDYFGELSLVTDREVRTSYVVAVTDCRILMLEKNAFRKYMRDYPEIFTVLQKELLRKYYKKIPRPPGRNSLGLTSLGSSRK